MVTDILNKVIGLFKRIFSLSRTKRPEDPECWKHFRGNVVLDWARVPELHRPCGAIRLEGRGLPASILVVYGMDGEFHVFRNRCPSCGGLLDPFPSSSTISCCGLCGSIFDYSGNMMSGVGKEMLKTYPVKTKKCQMVIRI